MREPSPPNAFREAIGPRRSCEATLRTELYAEAGGARFPLSQMCHLWLIPAEGVELPAGKVRVVSIIEGHTDTWEATLPHVRPVTDDPRIPLRGMRLLPVSEAA
ncbi:hypothetical protein [Phycisphaera mikurensis]|uniref:Uncharacterized protein n=1 Tax=Phycisphaera mikurensis (strain NBRC 102666 / KCTC 22515 / FYK2301M01) TaxID=1142394 RepID=I0ICE1_PHYMF|nr:hypothetical protein [Phycisphaera mikurensis]MBB6442194.1 hypothetical protein [Phycisphaera mikurensis]BAM02929.1 hypothetical protein PSMK_07700 [Phycisphaera mikurensis NBRC 102666]